MELSQEYLSKLERCVSGTSNVYVLDLSWHLHRSYYTFRNMSVSIGGYERPTGHIYGVLSIIKMIREIDKDSCIILTQDGIPLNRIQIVSETSETGYKEGREELEYDFYRDIPYIKALCCVLPKVFWAYNEDKECDDEMYALSRHIQLVNYSGKCYVYSGDNDLLQAIDERTVVIRNVVRNEKRFDEITDEVVRTDVKFTKKFNGVDTKHITNYRAICGDSSDKLKGISRFPRDIAVLVAMSSEDIRKGFSFVPVTDREKRYISVLKDNMEIVKRNYNLMKLQSDYEVKLYKPIVKKEKLSEVLETFKLRMFEGYLRREGIL